MAFDSTTTRFRSMHHEPTGQASSAGPYQASVAVKGAGTTIVVILSDAATVATPLSSTGPVPISDCILLRSSLSPADVLRLLSTGPDEFLPPAAGTPPRNPVGLTESDEDLLRRIANGDSNLEIAGARQVKAAYAPNQFGSGQRMNRAQRILVVVALGGFFLILHQLGADHYRQQFDPSLNVILLFRLRLLDFGLLAAWFWTAFAVLRRW